MKKIFLGAIFFAGCAAPYSEVPIATNFATTEQNKLQAALHWKVIANDLAKSIVIYRY